MARNTVRIEIPPEQVYEELLRAENFGEWVVGAKRVRGTSDGWPSQGARFHHTVGVGPFTISDSTRIEEMDPPKRLVLHARAWPLGDARIVLSLAASMDGTTQVVMVEDVLSGPAKLIPTAINQRVIHLRNRRSLRRLRRVVLRHHAG